MSKRLSLGKADLSTDPAGNDYRHCLYDAENGTYSFTYNIRRDGKGQTDEFYFGKEAPAVPTAE